MKNKELHSEFTFQIEPKHYFKHNYLTYCNDVLVSMLKYTDEEKMASVSIDLGNGENIEFEQDEKWQEWLITHGLREEMYEVYYRHTFFSLVADFCSYMLKSRSRQDLCANLLWYLVEIYYRGRLNRPLVTI